MNSYKT